MSLTVEEKLEAGPMFDMGIVEHHFTGYMRDYDIFVDVVGPIPGSHKSQVIGRCRYRFTHCVFTEVKTTVRDDVWASSWEDVFIDFRSWTNVGQPEGYVWGVEYMDAYPGLLYVADSLMAREWANRLNKPMHEVDIETNAHNIRLIFHDVEITFTSEGSSVKQEV